MMVKKIDEYICRSGIKIQKWKSEIGYDIAVVSNGIIISTYFTENRDSAISMFKQRIEEFEDKLF